MHGGSGVDVDRAFVGGCSEDNEGPCSPWRKIVHDAAKLRFTEEDYEQNRTEQNRKTVCNVCRLVQTSQL